MQAPVGEGDNRASHRQHLEAAARQGDLDAELELAAQPEIPAATAYLWGYFQDLHATRPSNGFGACRIPRTEIRAWEEGEGFTLQPWEVRAITLVDAAWVSAMVEQQPKPKG